MMFSRFAVLSIAAPFWTITAHAHQYGVTHAHPHLMISNDYIAAALMSGALVLVVAARHLLARRKK